MTLSIELPDELQTELATEAGRLGLSLSDYTLRLLQKRTQAGDLPPSGAELVSYWKREKLIGTRPEITDSPACARRIREQAERRRGA